MMTFLNEHDLINLMQNNTCFEGEDSYIELILTNRKLSFKNSTSIETGLSNHHHWPGRFHEIHGIRGKL